MSMMLGYMSSRPALMAYHDSTRTKSNSLSKSSQEIVALLDGKVKITTYTNLLDRDFWSTLPDHINFDKETFRPYTRFKPDMKIRYVYFYDNANNPELEEQYPDMSDEERAKQISENYGVPFSIFLAPEKMREIEDLSAEGNKTIRVIELENVRRRICVSISTVIGKSLRERPRFRLRSSGWCRKSPRSVSLPDMANGIFTGRGIGNTSGFPVIKIPARQ